MKFKKIMLVTLVLLAVLTIGAVSASEDVDALAVDDTGDDDVIASPQDDTSVSNDDGEALLGDGEPLLDENGYIQFYYDNITNREYSFCMIWEDSAGLDCSASVFANGSLVYDKPFESNYVDICAKDLNGTFDGYYNIKVVYTQANGTKWYKEQLTYFDNIIGKTTPPKPGDFNVTFADSELDLDEDRTETAVRLYIPATVLDGRIDFDGDISGYKYLYESDAGSYMELPLYFFSSITKPGSYDIIVNYIDEDRNELELARGTLNVTKTYSADDFIELYKANINSEDDFIFWVHELESQKPEGKLSIFYNGNQAFTKTYIGTMPAYITGKDLVGYFEGECNFTLVYERDADGKTYSKNLTANFATPINNKALTPEEFKVTFPNKEVDINDENKVIMTFFVPDGIADDAAIRVKYGPGSIDYKNILLYSSDINKTKQLTFGEMYIFDPTTLNLEVAYYVGSDKIVDIANSTLKVTKTYTANDFIEVYTKTLSGLTDYVCNVFDSDAGLVGDVTVFADNAQVYSKKFTNAANTAVRINGSDLSGNLKGQHDIKVVYKRSADGKEYSKTAVVTFPGDAPQPNPKSSITFSDASISFDYGTSGTISAVVSNGNIAKAVVLDHDEAIVDVKGSQITISNLSAGSYTLSVTTAPNANYDAVTESATIIVNRIASTITLSDIVVDYGKASLWNVATTGADGITATIDGNPARIQGNAVSLSGLSAGKYTLSVTTIADKNHNNVTKTVKLTINKVDSIIFIEDIFMSPGDTVELPSPLTTFADGFTAAIDGNPINAGNLTGELAALDVGTYTLTITTKVDENHNSVTKNVTVVVDEPSSLEVPEVVFDYGGSGTCHVTGTNEILEASVNSDKAIVKKEGNKITISGLDAGSYILTVKALVPPGHAVTKSAKITVNKANSTVISKDDLIFMGDNSDVDIKTTGATGFTALIDGKAIDADKLSEEISKLSQGNHILTITTIPDGNHIAVTKNITITVEAPVELTVSNVAFDYGGMGTCLVPDTFIIKNATVNSAKGVVKIVSTKSVNVSGLDAGTYLLTVEAYDTVSGKVVTATANVVVNKKATKITATAVSTTYGTGKYTTVTLTSNGKAISGKTVILYINGKACAKGITNDKGQVNLAVPNTLAVSNKHSATVQFDGDANYVKITENAVVKVAKAKPKLVAKAKSFKRSDKYKKYSLTLKTDKNKALYKAKVYIKVNKKTYSAVVNKKGIATFKLTKLTKKGKYSAVVVYKGNANYNAVKYTKLKIVVK